MKTSVSKEQDGSEVRGEITALEGKETIGTLRFADYADYHGGRTCQINWIEVAEDSRRKGVATALVARLRKEVPDSKPAQFFLNPQGEALKDAIYDDFAEPIKERGKDA